MKRSTKIVKKTAVVLWWIATVLIFLSIVRILFAKAKGEVPFFFGYAVMNIVSGSMGDTIPEGSYILIEKTDPADIRKGDIICFYSDDPAIRGYPNTHTVIEDPVQGENGLEFVTKGDANPTKDDATAKGEKLIGRHVKNLDALTNFSVMLEEKGIMVITLVLPVLCAICMIGSIYVKMKQAPEEEAAPSAEILAAGSGNSPAPEEIPTEVTPSETEPTDSHPPQT